MEPQCKTCPNVRPTFVWYLYVLIIACGVLFAICYPRWHAYRKARLSAAPTPVPTTVLAPTKPTKKATKEE